MINKRVYLAATLLLASGFASAEAVVNSTPDWASPKKGKAWDTRPADTVITVQGSDLSMTQSQVDDKFNAADWFPKEHKPMPSIVKHGIKQKKGPGVWACAMCHLSSGNGHPESAKLAGHTAKYIAEQVKAMQVGDRKPYNPFLSKLHTMPASEAKLAGEWFASLAPMPHQRVVESKTVPETWVDNSLMRLVKKGGTEEAINGRIIEVPEDLFDMKTRQPRAMFITYVPPGSLAKGESIATKGTEKVAACITCHGTDLKGSPLAPTLAGAFGTYTVRQLHDFRQGRRKGTADNAGLMSAQAKLLSTDEIVSVAAYIASLNP